MIDLGIETYLLDEADVISRSLDRFSDKIDNVINCKHDKQFINDRSQFQCKNCGQEIGR